MVVLCIFSFLAGLCTILSSCILSIIPIVLSTSSSKGRLRSVEISLGLILSCTFFTINISSIVQAADLSVNHLRYFPALVSENNQLIQEQVGQMHDKTPTANHESSTSLWNRYSVDRKAPELLGITNWINSQPLLLKDLRGKVVLLDFWTYTCINCLRTIPYIKDLNTKYKDKGLIVIGIHTPEFEFEKSTHNVLVAIEQLGITYPVALDNAYTVWRSYGNVFWPSHYLIDQNGTIVFVHFGEGGYSEMEQEIQKLLNLSSPTVANPKHQLRPLSPETYLGTDRGKRYTTPLAAEQIVQYDYSSPLGDDQVGLRGDWLAEAESITAEGEECYLDYNFLARRVYLVLSGTSTTPIQVSLDGQQVKQISIKEDRKYDIVDTSYGRHFLSLKIPKGISAYAFTFGDE